VSFRDLNIGIIRPIALSAAPGWELHRLATRLMARQSELTRARGCADLPGRDERSASESLTS
jgi:hypothetical protein